MVFTPVNNIRHKFITFLSFSFREIPKSLQIKKKKNSNELITMTENIKRDNELWK